jgi:hypothetical protein
MPTIIAPATRHTATRALLDAIELVGSRLDPWERWHIARGVVALSGERYGLAATEAQLALTPPEVRGCPVPHEPALEGKGADYWACAVHAANQKAPKWT